MCFNTLYTFLRFAVDNLLVFKTDLDMQLQTTVCEEDHIDDEEILNCLNGLSDNKAPGADNLPIEAYKFSPTARDELFRIVKLIWDTEEVPSDIVQGIFIMLYKKKDRNDFRNYRAMPSESCL